MRVAPFKAQNMANNAFATLEGGEIGVAQAVQAEACGLRPRVEMNPILLKPNGPDGSQIVRLGVAGETLSAVNYYGSIEESWRIVSQTLDGWKEQCDVLVMEGAGSPVELNLMDRDIANLRPVEYMDGRWLLVSNIEYGGVFAQILGTWNLLSPAMQARGLGVAVNRFRGDLSLFDGAGKELAARSALPYLGTIPFDGSLGIDDEDGLNAEIQFPDGEKPIVAWIKYPQVSNTPDQLPWKQDEGVQSLWTVSPEVVKKASVIVLPGSKNTLSDLDWLKLTGLAAALLEASSSGIPVIGICGGKQMLGKWLYDPATGRRESGLCLLPLETEFLPGKQVARNESRLNGQVWETFEIHTGKSVYDPGMKSERWTEIRRLGAEGFHRDGVRVENVFGSYQHGLFDSPATRQLVLDAAGLQGIMVSKKDWRAARLEVYDRMADTLESRLDLESVRRYLAL